MRAVFYELCGADPDRRFSPYCWRALMALQHKEIEFERRPLEFTEIRSTLGEDIKTVPVLEHGGDKISGSFEIAWYLEETFPDRPSLFGGEGGLALSKFLDSWANVTILGGTVRLIVSEIHGILGEDASKYFRETREKRFGGTLEALAENREEKIEAVRKALMPLRMTLKDQKFLGGDQPLYADYIVFGSIQWPRVASTLEILTDDDPLKDWFERCLDLHNGIGRAAAPLAA